MMRIRKLEIRYGVTTGIGICLWKLAEHWLGFNSTRLDIGQFTRTFAILLPIVMIVLGIREKRNIINGGTLEFSEGVKSGMIIAAVYGAITAIFFFIYQSFINPSYVDHLVGFERLRMLSHGIPESEIPEKLDAIRTMNAFPAILIFQFLGSLFSGLAISIIASAILRKRPAPTLV